MNDWTNTLHCGDAVEVLKQMPDESISCVVTSPPYWSQRDYKAEGQWGLEKTYQEWLEHLWSLMDEIWRVLRKDGTVFVNLGDKYGGNCSRASFGGRAGFGTPREGLFKSPLEKSLLFLPERFAIGCLERGWTIPNKNIWRKPNPTPSSGKGRFTNTWEYLFFMVKNTKPTMWIHRYTGEMVSKKPKDKTKIVCPGCEGKGKKEVMVYEDSMFPQMATVECSECGGDGEVSIWRSEDYFFDLDAVRRPHSQTSIERAKYSGTGVSSRAENMTPPETGKRWNVKKLAYNFPAGKNPSDVITTREKELVEFFESKGSGGNQGHGIQGSCLGETHPAGANPGDVITDPTDFWEIATQPSKEKHFAAFPEKLVLTPLKAGCPRWICKECGMARVRITKREGGPQGDQNKEWQGDESSARSKSNRFVSGKLLADRYKKYGYPDYHTLGWSFCSCLCPVCGEANCKCGAKWRPGVVLDPFAGTCTVGRVAKKLGLGYIMIDIKQEYLDMGEKMLKDIYRQEEILL